MKHKPTFILAAALAVGAVGWSPAGSFAQDATKQEQKAAKKEQKRQEKEARQAEKDRRAEEKREKALLNKMPAPARDALTAQTTGGTDVDYYRLARQQVFGATFKDAQGQMVDVRVDPDGQVISRLTSDQPGATATTDVAAQPVNSAQAEADFEAPEVGVLLNSDQLPEPVQQTMFKEIAGSPDPRYYRVMLGDKAVYETRYTTPDGKAMIAHVDENGKFIQRQEVTPDTPAAATSTSSTDREEIDFDKMPAEIRDAMRDATKGGEAAQFYRANFNGKPIFETRFWNDDNRRILVRMDQSGKVLETKMLEDIRRGSERDRKRDKDDRK